VRKALRLRVERRREHRPAVLTTLDRGERPFATWLEGLQNLVSETTYRTTAVAPEELVQIVEDAAATKRVRVAAAFALSRNTEPEVRRRVRIAALGCADEQTRSELDRAAVGEESVLARGEENNRSGHRIRQ